MNGEYGVYSRETGKLLRKGTIRDDRLEPTLHRGADEMAYIWLEGEKGPFPLEPSVLPDVRLLPAAFTGLTTAP